MTKNLTFYYYKDVLTTWFNTSPEPSIKQWNNPRTGELLPSEKKWLDENINVYSNFCAFCSQSKLTFWENELDEEDKNIQFLLKICPSCGWWKLLGQKELKYIPGYDSGEVFYEYRSNETRDYAILDSFNISDNSAPIDELTKILINDWKYSKYISAKKAQDLVMNVFKNHMNCSVHYYDNAVYSPDGGIDFVLVRTDERKIAFQVKRRQTEKNESVRPVREFIGAMANSKFNEGIYVTTAPHFTKYAQKEFRSAEYNLLNKKMRISLIDGSRLKNLLEFHQPDERFISIFRKIAKEYDWNNTSLSCRNYHISEVFSETESSSFSK